MHSCANEFVVRDDSERQGIRKEEQGLTTANEQLCSYTLEAYNMVGETYLFISPDVLKTVLDIEDSHRQLLPEVAIADGA